MRTMSWEIGRSHANCGSLSSAFSRSLLDWRPCIRSYPRALPVQEGFVQAQKSLAKIVEQFFRLLNFRDIVIGHRRPISHYA